MRALAIATLALLCGGCAAPAYDLLPRDPEAPWQVGSHWVRTESSRASVGVAYDHSWLGHLIFEVEIVNQSDSTLVIDPRQFSYALASSGADAARLAKRRVTAEDPAKVRALLERAQFGDDSITGTLSALIGTMAVVALGLTDASSGAEACSQPGDVEPGSGSASFMEARNECVRAAEALLQRTELAPGQAARGDVWLPARSLRRAIGGPPTPASEFSITATPAGPPPAHGLTLRVPEALGGEEFEYSVCAGW